MGPPVRKQNIKAKDVKAEKSHARFLLWKINLIVVFLITYTGFSGL